MENGKKMLMLLLFTAVFVMLFAACSAASAVVSETGGEFVRIVLESKAEKAISAGVEWEECEGDICFFVNDVSAGVEWKGEWKHETQGDGAIEEVSYSDYFEAAEKELSKQIPEEEDGMVILPDYPVPGGYVEFYLKGVRPGMTELLITCSSPDRSAPYAEAVFKLSVAPDLKISVLDSSENMTGAACSNPFREFRVIA